jgi:chromosome segregation ATPase
MNDGKVPTLRVTEVDPGRLGHLEEAISELRRDLTAKGIQIGSLANDLAKTDARVEKIDEAIRGNGKEGLNSIVRRTEEKLDALNEFIEKTVKEQIEAAIKLLELRVESQVNTEKFRAITQKEIDAYSERPGSWLEFRKTWIFPIGIMIISSLISAALTYIVIAGPK